MADLGILLGGASDAEAEWGSVFLGSAFSWLLKSDLIVGDALGAKHRLQWTTIPYHRNKSINPKKLAPHLVETGAHKNDLV